MHVVSAEKVSPINNASGLGLLIIDVNTGTLIKPSISAIRRKFVIFRRTNSAIHVDIKIIDIISILNIDSIVLILNGSKLR